MSRTATRRRAGDRGFTLLELIIVVALVTLLTGMAAIAVSGRLPSAKLKQTSRELAATLRRAKILAQIKGEDRIVQFFPEDGRYRLKGEGEGVLPEGTRMVIVDPVEGDLVEGRWDAVFFAEGGARAGTVRLEGDQGTFTIEIDPILGGHIR